MAGVDILVCTALDTEYDVAKNVATEGFGRDRTVADWVEHEAQPIPYAQGTIQVDGQERTIALAHPTRMGGLSTALLAGQLIQSLSPSCVAMCGACAGHPEDTALGDVIFAQNSYQYDEGKHTSEAGFRGDHMAVPVSERLLAKAQRFDSSALPSHGPLLDEEVLLWMLESLRLGIDPKRSAGVRRFVGSSDLRWNALVETLIRDRHVVRRATGNLGLTRDGRSHLSMQLYGRLGGPTQLPFAVLCGPMASGNAVVANGKAWQQLAGMGQRKILGLEMEAAALTRAAHNAQVPYWVVMKGVSDHANPHKSDRYKGFVERASAEALFAFLSDRIADGTLTPQPTGAGRHGGKAPPVVLREPPMVSPGTVQDRLPVLEQLKDWINAPRPAVALLTGPPGIGKSAVVNKLFDSIRQATDLDLGYAGYLSGLDYVPVTAATVLSVLRQTMTVSNASPLLSDRVWEAPLGWLESLDILLDNLQSKVLVVVDQLEELAEPSGTLRDNGLARLFQEIDLRSSRPIKLLLVGPEYVNIDQLQVGKALRIPLTSGLLDADARKLLREMLKASPDPAQVSDPTLARMARASGGQPRTLELLHALASQVGAEQALALDAAQRRTAGNGRVEHLTRLVVDRLSPGDREVLHAAAALAQPVPPEAIAFVMDAPVFPVTSRLEVLRRRRILRAADGVYYLPPDRRGEHLLAYQHSGHPKGTGGTTLVRQQLARAADYFARHQEADPARVEDLRAHFGRLQVLITSNRATDALSLMKEMDEHLGRWGRRDALVETRRRIHAQLPSAAQQVHNLSCVALALDQGGQHEESLRCLTTAINLCERDAPEATAYLAAQAGTAYLNLGKHQAALRQLRRAQDLTQRHQITRLQLPVADSMCACLIEVGHFTEAIDIADALFGTLEPVSSRATDEEKKETWNQRAHLMCNFAAGLSELGRRGEARELLEQALDIARTYDDTRTGILCMTAQAIGEVLRDDPSHAMELALEAAEQARLSGNLSLSRGAYLTLALAQLRSGLIKQALASSRAATRYDSRAKAVGAWSVHGLVCYRAEDYHQAAAAFQQAMNGARKLIRLSPDHYQAHEAMALASLGLSLCPDWSNSLRLTRSLARKHYALHRRITRDAPGPARHARILATELTLGMREDILADLLEERGSN